MAYSGYSGAVGFFSVIAFIALVVAFAARGGNAVAGAIVFAAILLAFESMAWRKQIADPASE